MNDIPFYRTQMGYRYYETTAPAIARELARLNDNLERMLGAPKAGEAQENKQARPKAPEVPR